MSSLSSSASIKTKSIKQNKITSIEQKTDNVIVSYRTSNTSSSSTNTAKKRDSDIKHKDKSRPSKKQKKYDDITLITSSTTSSSQALTKNIQKFKETSRVRDFAIKTYQKRVSDVERKDKSRSAKRQKVFDIRNVSEWIDQLNRTDRLSLNEYIIQQLMDNFEDHQLGTVLLEENFKEYVFKHKYSQLVSELTKYIHDCGTNLERLLKPKFDFEQIIRKINDEAKSVANSANLDSKSDDLSSKYDDHDDDDDEYDSDATEIDEIGSESIIIRRVSVDEDETEDEQDDDSQPSDFTNEKNKNEVSIDYNNKYVKHVINEIKVDPTVNLTTLFQQEFLNECCKLFSKTLVSKMTRLNHQTDLNKLESEIYEFYSFFTLYQQWKQQDKDMFIDLESFCRSFKTNKQYCIKSMDVQHKIIQIELICHKLKPNKPENSPPIPHVTDESSYQPYIATFVFKNGKYWRNDDKKFCNLYIPMQHHGLVVSGKKQPICMKPAFQLCLCLEPLVSQYVLSPWLNLHSKHLSLPYTNYRAARKPQKYCRVNKSKIIEFEYKISSTQKRRSLSTWGIIEKPDDAHHWCPDRYILPFKYPLMTFMYNDYSVYELVCLYTHITYSNDANNYKNVPFVSFMRSPYFHKTLLDLICDFIEISRIALTISQH